MTLMNRDQADKVRLVVFSDDWGRHPSSCQHLIGKLLDRYPVLWVNTIGTRAPRLSLEDLSKTWTKLRQWVTPAQSTGAGDARPANLSIVTPKMYPGFRRPWQRALNARLIARAVNTALGPRATGEKRVAITTIPITADLPGLLEVDAWVYYCVDDFSVWPGLDGGIMHEMERALVRQADAILAVSRTLQQRIDGMGGRAELLTHGIDLAHWREAGVGSTGGQAVSGVLPADWASLPRPIALFWGVVDQRLDARWCQAIADACGTLALVGPHQSPEATLLRHPKVYAPGPVGYDALPALARESEVLVMPYADLPVTRAMQPLKLKEYLATTKPAVIRDLPSTREWADAADVVATPAEAAERVLTRAAQGLPDTQATARRRLDQEDWGRKAAVLEGAVLGALTGRQ